MMRSFVPRWIFPGRFANIAFNIRAHLSKIVKLIVGKYGKMIWATVEILK